MPHTQDIVQKLWNLCNSRGYWATECYLLQGGGV